MPEKQIPSILILWLLPPKMLLHISREISFCNFIGKNKFLFIILFMCLFLSVIGLSGCTSFSLVVESEGCSLRWLLLLWTLGLRYLWCVASTVGAPGLEHRLSRCGTQAKLLCGMWDLPGSGIEPVSPALVGRFFTTEPPGKPEEVSSDHWSLLCRIYIFFPQGHS